MGLFDRMWQGLGNGINRLTGWQSRFNLKNPSDWKYLLEGNQSAAGVSITADSSLTFSTFFDCLDIIATHVGYLPKQIRRRTDRGSELDKRHDQYTLIHSYPNPWQNSFNFWREFIYNQVLWGNGLALIQRKDGRPVAYLNLNPQYCEPVWEGGELFIVYQGKLINEQAVKEPIPYRDVIHIPNSPGIWGKSTVSIARDTIGLGKASENVTGKFFKDYGFMARYFKHPSRLSDKQRGVIVESLKKYRERPWSMPLLDEGMSIEGVNMPIGDFEFLATRKFTVEDMARFFRFSALHKLGHLERMSFNNIYEMAIEFRQTTLLPYTYAIEQELARKTLKKSEINGDTHFYKWEYKGLLQADLDKTGEFFRTMFNTASMSPNEMLAKMDMDGIGSEGDRRYVMANMIPAELAIDYWKSIISEPKNPERYAKDFGVFAENGNP